MTKHKQSKAHGVLKSDPIDPQRAMQSSNAENPSISVTLVSTAPKNPACQVTPNLQADPKVVYSKIIQVFAEKLIALGKAEWRKVLLTGGKEAYALCFLTDHWIVDPLTKELTPYEKPS